jgi:hypothetical protein
MSKVQQQVPINSTRIRSRRRFDRRRIRTVGKGRRQKSYRDYQARRIRDSCARFGQHTSQRKLQLVNILLVPI